MSDEAVEGVVLSHTPDPAVEGSIFEDPRFSHHVAFLRSMLARGWLLAAGPFADRQGEGMTVLRIPGGDAVARARELAEADRAVIEGLLVVEVRPWAVQMEAEGLGA